MGGRLSSVIWSLSLYHLPVCHPPRVLVIIVINHVDVDGASRRDTLRSEAHSVAYKSINKGSSGGGEYHGS